MTDYRPILADIGEEALTLFNRRRREAREQARREQSRARELAIQQTMKDFLKRREAKAQERARKEAQQEAEELAERRREIEERAEEHASALAQDLRDLEEVHVRHRAKLHEAGTPVSADYRLADILTLWFRPRFGGHHAITGVPAPHHALEDSLLPERDPLASARTERTAGEAS